MNYEFELYNKKNIANKVCSLIYNNHYTPQSFKCKHAILSFKKPIIIVFYFCSRFDLVLLKTHARKKETL